jgi:FMN-dependent oxidoreductase (nitrilotriacetate monooxygenase family)
VTKPLLLNAFEMLTPVHQSPGLWRHPDSQAARFAELDYWTDLARALEDGGFHGIFFADVLGQYDVYGGSADEAVRGGVQYPLLDPLLIVSALAAATERLGFGITASVTYEQPYLLARKFGTLDHLTKGRVGWNIVTSYQESAARNLGLGRQLPHDERYDRAEEFMDVVYKLWEASVDDDAIRADAVANVLVDPAGVRGIGHEGAGYSVPGPALVGPSPQRTPLLFQAGASSRGKAFAAKHAEAVFFSSSTPAQARKFIEGLRAELVGAGRAADSVKVFNLATVIVAETDEAAAAKLADYEAYVDTDAALALFAGWTGIDLSGLDQDAPLEYIKSEANQSALAQFTTLDPERNWTLREVAKFVSIGGRGPVLVGSPTTIADEFERWVEEAGVDGFNLTSAVRPADLLEFARLVSPELRRRGLLAEGAEGATFRETILGAGPRLAADHPGLRAAGVAVEA